MVQASRPCTPRKAGQLTWAWILPWFAGGKGPAPSEWPCNRGRGRLQAADLRRAGMGPVSL